MYPQIIYYSKCGATKDIAHTIGKKMGLDNISDIRELKEITSDVVIVGSAIYAEAPHIEIMRLLKDKEGKLQDKQVALFVVCLAKESRKFGGVEVGGSTYLRKMERALGRAPMATKIFGGKLMPSEMHEEDRKQTEEFYKKHGMAILDINITSEREVVEFIGEIKDMMKQ